MPFLPSSSESRGSGFAYSAYFAVEKGLLFLMLVKNTYLTRSPPARVLTNIYRGFV
jgi:hypothetical protein